MVPFQRNYFVVLSAFKSCSEQFYIVEIKIQVLRVQSRGRYKISAKKKIADYLHFIGKGYFMGRMHIF